ncbi:AsmA family protein [Methylobacillus caricis]|uniref:AsmA family protein n=1 Tax=Methylobacillus caricis TaxID=1971611 RepID=UPI001CFFC7BC|nr:AsmA family protein [Methylobacillus caricis]MCB5187770.1 AsmA family protein [Methylobacillus caricis]
MAPIKVLLWLLLTMVIVAIVCEILGWPFLRAPAERLLNEKLERTVKLEQPFQLHLWAGVQLDLGHLFISAPASFTAPHLVDAHNISLKLRYRDLWQYTKNNQLRIREIKVDQIDAQLLRQADGTSTWQFPKDESQPDSPFPIIETLVVKNGSSKIDDAISQAAVDAKFRTEEGSNSQETMHSELSINGKFQNKPVKAFLETAGFLPIATQDQNSPPIKSKGWMEYAKLRIDFDGQISDLFGKKNIQGKAVATGSSLGILGDLVGTPLPTTDPFRLSATLDKTSDIWNIDIDSAKVGKSSLSAQLKYDPRTDDTVPLLQGHIDGSRFYLADLAPAFGTSKPDGTKAAPAGNRAIPDRPLDLPSLNQVDMDISLKLDYVELGNAFALPISPLKGHLKIYKGRFTVEDILARTADGTLSGTLSVDAGEPPVKANSRQYAPQWQIKLAWKDIVLEKWLQVSKTRQEEARKQGKTVPPPYVTGTLNGKTDLTGKGSSTAALLGSLNGKTTLFIEQGQISRLIVELMGLDVAQSVSAWLGGDQSLNMQCALMDLKATNGIIKPEVALIDTPVTLLLINGNVDMGEEKLDLLLAAKPKNFSPLTVRSPIKVQGTFVQPKVSPEAVPIAARLLGSVALAFINPLAAILPYLDTGSKSNSYSCSQALAHFNQQQKPQ